NSKQRLLELIDGAQHTLDVELMYLSEVTIRDAIGRAAMRGVAVRALLPDDAGDELTYLQNVGVPVRTPHAYYLHSKLIIADDVAFVGSENMSLTSLTKNREVGARVFEPSAFSPIRSQF